MYLTLLLIALPLLLIAGLIYGVLRVYRGRQRMQQHREALKKQRGAAHIREIALAAQQHTGRADIAVMLMQLSVELLEEAVRLAPAEPAVSDSLQHLHNLMDSMQLDDRAAAPVPNPDSLAELTRVSMQLTEAIRLLVRLEARGEMNRSELKAMQSDLRRVQKSVELRTRMRQELETPSVLIDATNAPLPLGTASQAEPLRIEPTH